MLNRIIQLLLVTVLMNWSHSAVAASGLMHHPSPYLAMHADDPVDWQTWNENVLQQARQQNKLIFVSIGYFACHWCHVMQRESYQNPDVAEILNEHFVSVKIDRELRPELDRRLIDFVVSIRGSAGWPLNVFLTPDGYPVTGFTYLPAETFSSVLLQLQQQWLTRRAEVNQAAQSFHLASIAEADELYPEEAAQADRNRLAQGFISQAMAVADELQGGFGDTSKFPQHPQLSSLLDLVSSGVSVPDEVVEFIHLTLAKMAGRHLIDHLYGGFFRYTTDPDWQTPHYEKMLYDNAQMVLLYFQAAQQWPGRGYGEIAEATLNFILENMSHPRGGFVSSLSAVDVDNHEGGRYLWHLEELTKQLSKQDYGYITELWQLDSSGEAFLLPALSGPYAEGKIDRNRKIKAQLLLVDKPHMPIDDKRLASWNALVLQALIKASTIDRNYRAEAGQLFEFMQQKFFKAGELIRFVDNSDLAETTFEDYAYVASAFQQYGKDFGNKQAIEQARSLVVESYRRFYSNGKWITDESSLLPNSSGRFLLQDGVLSSPLTQWLSTVFRLTGLPQELRGDADAILTRVDRSMLDTPYYHGTLIALRYRFDR